MLLFYDREGGNGKVFTYSSSGAISQKNSWSDWATDWDVVLFNNFGSFNAVFYRRSDGLVEAYEFGADGSKVFKFSQGIDDPNGSASGAKTGWDIVRAGRFNGSSDSLLFYNRVTGTAKFYSYSPSTNRFVVSKSFIGWQHGWDQMELGDFNRDGVADLVAYNQDSGELKLIYFNSAFSISSEAALADAGLSHGARIAVANFGGLSGQDVMLYQHDRGAAPENGRARIWVDSTSGGMTLLATHTTWQDRWTHLVPVDLGEPQTGFLVYSNQHVINVRIIPMSSSAPAPYAWTSGELTAIAHWQAAMRKTYATAGLGFNFVVWNETVECPDLATWVCSRGDDRDAADACIAANIPPDVLTVAIATESTDGTGCSNMLVDFVRGRITSKDKYLAHEVGHYFGLPHSHYNKTSKETVEAALSSVESSSGRQAIARDLDSDRGNGSEFFGVLDTPPTLRDDYWTNTGGDMCAEGQRLNFTTSGGTTVSMWVSPHDVMAYNNCHALYRLTDDQVRVVRQTLYSVRPNLIP